MEDTRDVAAQASISRRDLLTTTGKVAAGAAVAGALTQAPGASRVLASSSRASTTLNFLTGLGGPDGQTMQAMVKQFNTEHPSITVKMQTIGTWTAFYSKLLPALSAGNAPEVFTTHVQEMLYFQDKGLFLQLDDLFNASMPKSDFAPLAMQYATYQGHTYGMPLDIHGWAMFINPALFAKAGLPARSPKTSAELVTWARKLTVDKNGNNGLSPKFDGNHVDQYGIAVEWAQVTFLSTLWSFGGNTLSPDGKKAMFNTPQAKAALTFWHDMIFKYHAAAKPSSTTNTVAFPNNKLAMWPNGDWMRNYFPLHKNVPVKCVYLPPFGQKDVAWMSGHVISAPAGLSGAKKDAVYTFMRWLSTRGLQWTEGAGHIPARISQRTQPAVLKLFPQSTYAPELSEIGHIEQPSTVFFDVQDAYTAEIDAAMNGVKSVDAALAAAQSRVTRALAGAH